MACIFMPDCCPILDHLIDAYIKNYTGPQSLLKQMDRNINKKKVLVAPLPTRMQV